MKRTFDQIDYAIAIVNLRDPLHDCQQHCAPSCFDIVAVARRLMGWAR